MHGPVVHQGSHRPGKVLEFYLGPGKLLEFQNSAICPGIVLEFRKIALENGKLSLKIMNFSVLLDLCDARKKTVKIAGFFEGRGVTVLRFTGFTQALEIMENLENHK